MKVVGVWIRAVGHLLVAWLISGWGAALILIGTLALAGSAAAYLTGTYDHQALVGGSIPNGPKSVPAQSLGTSQWRIGDPCPPVSTPASAPLCWSTPGTTTVVPAQSLCTILTASGALTLPAQCNTAVPAGCTPSLLLVAPDIACDDR
jgi:hypothetical protein